MSREIAFEAVEAGQLNVLTFNIRYGSADDGENSWEYRKELVFDVLASHQADIVGLQEAEAFQVQEIEDALPQYGVVYAGREDGKKAGEACPVLYRLDRFTLEDSGTFWFSNSPWKVASTHWGNDLPRICTWVRLTEIDSGKHFYVYNLHLDHASQVSRVKSTELLAKTIAKQDPPGPFMVIGDFNMGMNNPGMLYLQQIGYETPCSRLVDSWQMLNRKREPVGTYHGFKGDAGGKKVDHILVTDDTEIIEVGIDKRAFGGQYPSDHFPVYATIRLVR
ncbi:MAG: endonuclease/exonuclease/phosphatase family protein [Planctomycetota bacterium]